MNTGLNQQQRHDRIEEGKLLMRTNRFAPDFVEAVIALWESGEHDLNKIGQNREVIQAGAKALIDAKTHDHSSNGEFVQIALKNIRSSYDFFLSLVADDFSYKMHQISGVFGMRSDKPTPWEIGDQLEKAILLEAFVSEGKAGVSTIQGQVKNAVGKAQG